MVQPALFANQSFYIADSEPGKNELEALIKDHDGRIVESPDDGQPVWLGSREHTTTTKVLVDVTYIADCIKQKKMLPRNKYLLVDGDELTLSRAATRKSFTAKDKRILRDWVLRQENFGYRLGERIYKELSAIHPQHTAESWQNHWKKNIESTLTKEQRRAYLHGKAAPDSVSEDEDDDEEEVVEQQKENSNVEETVQVTVQTESETVETHHAVASHKQKNKQAANEEHNATQIQSSKKATRSNTQQPNTQIHDQDNDKEISQSQSSRRRRGHTSLSSVAKQTNPAPATSTSTSTSTSSQPAPARNQSGQNEDKGDSAPLDQAVIDAIVDKFFNQKTTPSNPSQNPGKRKAVAGEHESQETNKAAKLDYSQLYDSDDSVTSDPTQTGLEEYCEINMPWCGEVNAHGQKIYFYDGNCKTYDFDVQGLMKLSQYDMIDLRDVSDPRWRSYAKWCVGPYVTNAYIPKTMWRDAPSSQVFPPHQQSSTPGGAQPISRQNISNPEPIERYRKDWKQFGDDVSSLQSNADRASPYESGDSRQNEPRRSIGASTSQQPHVRGPQHNSDGIPSHASTEPRQQQPRSNTVTTSRQPSASNTAQKEPLQRQSIIEATASNEAKHIRLALAQKTYNDVSSVTDADHKRWLMDIRGLMMDYDMTAFQVIRTVRSFSGDWEAARAFLHQLKSKRGANTSNSVSGNIRIDTLLRDRDQLTRLAWSEKHDNILLGGVTSEIDKLMEQKGRNNTLARQEFLKHL